MHLPAMLVLQVHRCLNVQGDVGSNVLTLMNLYVHEIDHSLSQCTGVFWGADMHKKIPAGWREIREASGRVPDQCERCQQ